MAQPTQERLASQLEKPEKTSGNVGHAGSGTEPENSPHYQDHEDDHVHHVAMSTYYVIFALLMFLLFITVGAWYIDQHYYPLGKLSTPIAMAIAVAKAVAIVLFFMHVKFSSKLVQIFACTGVAFVGIMFALTLQDYTTRDWLPVSGVYSTQGMESEVGSKGLNEGIIVRSSSEGAASNAQSTPADNMMTGSMPTQTGRVAPATNASGAGSAMSSSVRGADITLSAGAAEGSPNSADGRRVMGNTGPTSGVVGQRDDSRPGAILGGAANNSFGSEVQSRGIEPKPAANAPTGARVPNAGTVPPRAPAAAPATGTR